VDRGPASKTRYAVGRDALLQGAGTALVAVFSYATASQVPFLRETFWAPIAAIVVLYPDGETTRKAALERFLGTAIGSLIGWASAATWHHHIAVYGAAVVLAVGACHLLKLEATSRLCAVAVTVITIVPHADRPHLVALYRFIEVSYGVLCALAYTTVVDRVKRRRRGAATPAD